MSISSVMKKRSYREIVIREKAREMARASSIDFDEAYAIVKKKTDESDARLKAIGRKSKTKLRKEAKGAKRARDSTLKEFGVRLTPGAPPFQGGSPGGGKRR